MNEIFAIRPYWLAPVRCWVFDDEKHGLKAEAFVAGMSEIIDRFVEDNGMEPKKSFTIFVSRSPIPNSSLHLKKIREEAGGCWYETVHPQPLEGWLCPALFHYFDHIPEDIYITKGPEL